MKSPRRKAVHSVLAAATIAFGGLVRLLPLPVARCVGRALGRLAYYLVPKIRRVGLANVALAFGPDAAAKDGPRLVRRAAENVGMVAAEFSFIPHLRDRRFREKYVRVEGLERMLDGPCIVIGAHFGNWEWLGCVLAQYGMDAAEVVRPLDNPRLDAYVDGVRRAGGVDTIAKSGAGIEILRRLRRGQRIGILVDQSPRDNGVPAEFFGAPCWATAAPAMAARLAKVPIHPVSLVRDADARYVLTIYPALALRQTGDKREDLVVNAQRCQQAVEELVRAHPEQWLWFHRRWKRRPKLEQQWRERQSDAAAE